jgi:hypothetical protein
MYNVYTKEGTRVPSLYTGVWCVPMNKTGGKRKMFITRANADAQHLLGPFSSPFFGVKLLYDYGFRCC